MIIYGSKTVHLDSIRLNNTVCPRCGTQGSLILSVYRTHVHIFWIPLFPIGKKGLYQCNNCNNILDYNEMPEQAKWEYDNVKNEVKGPIWQFSGIAILATLIVAGIYNSGENKKLELGYLASPMEGDIYEYKIEPSRYSTLKVVSFSDDSVFVSPNEYEINKSSRIYEIDDPENYSKEHYGLSKDKLIEMYDSGEIIDINR